MEVTLYTDGACRGNPGPGGWGVVLECAAGKKSLQGAEKLTTNNRMELKAAIEGFKSLKRACDVNIYTDSTYVKNGITIWIKNWKQKNWRTSSGKEVKNQDLWQQLDSAMQPHNVNWHWVKGHSGHKGNDEADFLATSAIDNLE